MLTNLPCQTNLSLNAQYTTQRLAPHLAEIYTRSVLFTNNLRIPSLVFCQLRPRTRSAAGRSGGRREGSGGGRRAADGPPLQRALLPCGRYEVDMEEFYRGDINRILEISGYGDQEELYEVRRRLGVKIVLVCALANET